MIHARTSLSALVLVAALLLVSCASADDAGSSPSPSPSPAPTATSTGAAPSDAPAATTAAPDVRTLRIEVEGTRVDPTPSQVDLAVGETLRLVVTADGGEAVHAHGFGDLEVPVTPGEPVALELVGSEPGVFEVELHSPDLLLAQVAVR